ncbi:uncharacterized [Tachysurus ichikawai]
MVRTRHEDLPWPPLVRKGILLMAMGTVPCLLWKWWTWCVVLRLEDTRALAVLSGKETRRTKDNASLHQVPRPIKPVPPHSQPSSSTSNLGQEVPHQALPPPICPSCCTGDISEREAHVGHYPQDSSAKKRAAPPLQRK